MYYYGIRPSSILSGGHGLPGSVLGRLQAVVLLLAFALGVNVPGTDAQDEYKSFPDLGGVFASSSR